MRLRKITTAFAAVTMTVLMAFPVYADAIDGQYEAEYIRSSSYAEIGDSQVAGCKYLNYYRSYAEGENAPDEFSQFLLKSDDGIIWRGVDSGACAYLDGSGSLVCTTGADFYNEVLARMPAGSVIPVEIPAQASYTGAAVQQTKNPAGTFYLNGQYIPTMPDIYPDAYFDSVEIGQEGGGYWFCHVNGRHPGTAAVAGIQPGVPTRYAAEYKGGLDESGTFIYDGADTIYLAVDGTGQILTYIRR